ncbi:MAG: transcriptional repressor LexA [Planctomycetota bacterium]
MSQKALTPRQREVLDVILATIRDRGYFPTVREIAAALNLRSPATVDKHLKGLVARGQLVRREGRLVPAKHCLPGAGGVPVVGNVAAGLPVDAVEHRQGTLSMGDLFGGEAGRFAVRVRGDSMEEEGILDGDFAIVEAGKGRPGDVVLAYVGPQQEATVKVLRRGPAGEVVLEPRNRLHAPLTVKDDPDFRIGGKVVGVLRKFGK